MKNYIAIILLIISFNSYAQTKLSIVPQAGISDFYFNEIRRETVKYRDYRDALYLGIDVSLERELFRNFSVSGSVGFTKIGMRGKAYINEFEYDNKEYIKEIWSTFSIYNTRLSASIEYNIGDIITVGSSFRYTREIIAYEAQQEVWLTNWFNADRFFEKQPPFRYDEFKKDNFYVGFYLKHFVTPKIAVSLVTNMALDSITPIPLQYHTRPFEYYVGISFYPFVKNNAKENFK